MPVRTLNYTHRKKIRREDAQIRITAQNGVLHFDAELDLARYKLPADASVYVEAYRRAAHYRRFDFGSVSAVSPPQDRSLIGLGSAEGIKFRVKVVTSSIPMGMLLAEADKINPRASDGEGDAIEPLLTVVPDPEVEKEVWRLSFEGDRVELLVNPNLGDWRVWTLEPAFVSLVLPNVTRQVLWNIVHPDLEAHSDVEDMDDWRSRWLAFGLSLPGVCDLPPLSDEMGREDWVESVVSAFSEIHNICAQHESSVTREARK